MTTQTQIETVDSSGTKHTISSELPSFIGCDEWIKKNKSPEVVAAWKEFTKTGVITEESNAAYEAWIIDQKITHSSTDQNGTEFVNHHGDYTE